ncbi:unnamed protein product [Debaryomyces tyrocola]|nr:unnamed protein product [Debaryomyces tyrocola]
MEKIFIFFCVMPFTEYEFQGSDGNFPDPDTLHSTSTNVTTYDGLIGTFSDIEFESFKQKLQKPDSQLICKLF